MVIAKYLQRKYPGMFVNLHAHTDIGSILDALKLKYGNLKQIGINLGIAITEHQSLTSILHHYHEMKKVGLTPIFGVELYTENFLSHSKNIPNNYGHNKKTYHLVLLCKSIQGLLGLYKIVSDAEDRKTSENQRIPISLDEILPYKEHFVCMSACLGGELAQYLKHGQNEEAKEYALMMRNIFGDDFYIEIQRHGIEDEAIVNPGLVKLSRELNIKLVATPDAHYTEPQDKIAHNALYAIRFNKKLNDPNPPGLPGDNYHLYTPEFAEKLFYDLPDALDNTIEIFEKCKNVEIPFPKSIEDYHFPKFPTPQGYSEAEYFRKLCIEGFNRRFAGTSKLNDPVYINRLQREMNTIIGLNFPGYFLLVLDIVTFCKNNDIGVGPGRGSVGGSLVAFCLGITDRIDPLEYDLLFERFLNSARKNAPDIDLDFESARRGEILEYLRCKYGHSRTAQIITFGVMKAKKAIDYAGKVLDYPYSLRQSISKLIPNKPDITLVDAVNSSQTLLGMYQNDERVKMILDLALKLEGTVSNKSTHAAGFVVTDKKMSSYIPTLRVWNKDKTELVKVTQFTMLDVEALGLLKIDILGLNTIDQLKDCENLINKTRAYQGLAPISLNTVPLNDVNVYKGLLGTGKTFGVFQISSKDMTNLMKKLYSNGMINEGQVFEDLIAGISLNRPGPMKSIPKFLANRLNPNNIQYDTEKLSSLLNSTYGTLVYQEQVALIAQTLAGYSPEQADIMRRAVSKKNDELLEQQRQPFIYGQTDNYGNIIIPGCIRQGVDENAANKIFNDLVDFSKYAFNKSHAASYGVLSIEGAWAKYYYPTEFMTSLLNSAALGGNNDKLSLTLLECKNMGIQILPPDINKSQALFSIEGPNTIRYGLAAIKKLGYSSVQRIIKERAEEGCFNTYGEVAHRLKSAKAIKKDSLEALIYAGALDSLGGTRKAKIESVEEVLDDKKQNFNYLNTLIPELSAVNSNNNNIDDEFDDLLKLHEEREYLGAFISDNPLNKYQTLIQNGSVDCISSITRDDDSEEDLDDAYYPDGTTVKLIGYVLEVKVRQGKRKQFITFEIADLTGTIKGTAGIEYLDDLKEGNIVYITAPVEHTDSFGTQLKFAKVAKLFRKGDELNTDMISPKRDSMVVSYVSNLNEIERFTPLVSMQSVTSNIGLYFVCLETGRKFAFNNKISLQDQRVLDLLRINSEYLSVR